MGALLMLKLQKKRVEIATEAVDVDLVVMGAEEVKMIGQKVLDSAPIEKSAAMAADLPVGPPDVPQDLNPGVAVFLDQEKAVDRKLGVNF